MSIEDQDEARAQRRAELAKKLEPVLAAFTTLLQRYPQLQSNEAQLRIDVAHLDLISKSFQFGNFSFWGGILPVGLYDSRLPVAPAAAIKNIRIPKDLRRQGLGSEVVKTWEDTLTQQGIKTFLALNLTKESMKFWQEMGYEPLSEEGSGKPVPYAMYRLSRQSTP